MAIPPRANKRVTRASSFNDAKFEPDVTGSSVIAVPELEEIITHKPAKRTPKKTPKKTPQEKTETPQSFPEAQSYLVTQEETTFSPLRVSEAVVPQQALYNDLQKELRSSPQKELRSSPHKDLRSSPQKDLRSSPQKELHYTPQKELHYTPQKQLRSSPQKEVELPLHGENKSARRQRCISRTPLKERLDSPQNIPRLATQPDQVVEGTPQSLKENMKQKTIVNSEKRVNRELEANHHDLKVSMTEMSSLPSTPKQQFVKQVKTQGNSPFPDLSYLIDCELTEEEGDMTIEQWLKHVTSEAVGALESECEQAIEQLQAKALLTRASLQYRLEQKVQ